MTTQGTMSHIEEIVAAEREAESLVAQAFNEREKKITLAKEAIIADERESRLAQEKQSADAMEQTRTSVQKQSEEILADATTAAQEVENISDADIARAATAASDKLFA